MKPEDPTNIPDDVLLIIFSLMPLVSLYKFKVASKSWYALISSIINKLLPIQVHGLFCGSCDNFSYHPITNRTNAIGEINVDASFSFLPSYEKMTIFDCCNGLVLLGRRSTRKNRQLYYVCNLILKSWTALPEILLPPYSALLYFNPWASPHYQVASITFDLSLVVIDVYSSRTKRWYSKTIICKPYILPRMHLNRNFAFWNGDIYVIAPCRQTMTDYQTMRLSLVQGHDIIGNEAIEFPQAAERLHPWTVIGKLMGKLCVAILYGVRLKIWSLSGNRWVDEHTCFIDNLRRTCNPKSDCRVVGFHPYLDVVLILIDGIVTAYDMEKRTLEDFCEIGLERYELGTKLFPFSPCSLDLLEQREDNVKVIKFLQIHIN